MQWNKHDEGGIERERMMKMSTIGGTGQWVTTEVKREDLHEKRKVMKLEMHIFAFPSSYFDTWHQKTEENEWKRVDESEETVEEWKGWCEEEHVWQIEQ